MTDIAAYAAPSAASRLGPFRITRRGVGPQDVEIEILYCGVCHSDMHNVHNDWGISQYPLVPGHEIVGRVTKAGSQVRKFREGDLAGVGCLVDSCRECESCREGLEQFCEVRPIWTYGGPDKHTGGVTYGGYSKKIVVDQAFTLRVSDKFDLAAAAPLLCAGITTYSPLRHWNVGKGQRVGVVGLGGLGHMGVKLARAMEAHVVLFTTSPNKREDGLRLGAHEVVVSKSPDEMQACAGRFDFILDTVSAQHDVNAYLQLLRRDGALVLVGLPAEALSVAPFAVVGGRRSLAGSSIGGLRETQEMLDFCAEHNIAADIEMIPIQQINEAYERMQRSDVKYRFVIDMASLGA